jgi:hypothetical protein
MFQADPISLIGKPESPRPAARTAAPSPFSSFFHDQRDRLMAV